MTATLARTVVPISRPERWNGLAVSPNRTQVERLHAWSESWADEPLPHLPDLPPDLVDCLPEAVRHAREALGPGDPAEVMAALVSLASRRGFPLPDGLALELDVEVISTWPRDLWRKAFRCIWEQFRYRRMPEVADFHAFIEAELAERRSRLHRLESLRLKLETIRLKQAWDEEFRSRRPRPGVSDRKDGGHEDR